MDESAGLYEKYRIQRMDGGDAPGEKHADCEYFVLDVTHDARAIPALKAYQQACREAGDHALAEDLAIMLAWRAAREG